MKKKILYIISFFLLIVLIFTAQISFSASIETQSTHDNNGNGSGTQVAAATVNAGQTQAPIYGFAFNVTSGGPASFTAVNFTTSGTYVAGDVANFKLWECNFDVFPSGSQVQRGSTITTGLGTGTHTFSALGISIATGSSHAFYITVDIAAAPTNGHTIICNIITAANVTISGTDNFGTNIIGGTQTISAPMPVELLSFSGRKYGNENILEWITASEWDNDFFTLEHSKDGIFFSQVTKIKGAGNSNTTLRYSSVDAEPFPSINYYRLKQTDFNGNFTYSDMIVIGDFHPPDFSVSPNPVKNDCYINFYSEEEKNIRADILNYSGQYVMTLNFFIPKGEGYFYMDTRTLAEGIYLLKLSDCSFQKNITVLKL